MSNSMTAVLDGPTKIEEAGEWVELDDELDAPVSRPATAGLNELEPPVRHPSQHAMRFGPRAYTPRQAKVIDLAVRSRRPLSAPPLQLDD